MDEGLYEHVYSLVTTRANNIPACVACDEHIYPVWVYIIYKS